MTSLECWSVFRYFYQVFTHDFTLHPTKKNFVFQHQNVLMESFKKKIRNVFSRVNFTLLETQSSKIATFANVKFPWVILTAWNGCVKLKNVSWMKNCWRIYCSRKITSVGHQWIIRNFGDALWMRDEMENLALKHLW